MKTGINISFLNKVRFRKKVHSQASDHVWFFLNLFSKRPREKKGGEKEEKEKEKEDKGKRKKIISRFDACNLTFPAACCFTFKA